MVVWVSKKAGVGQHQCGIALVPKGAVVAQANLVDLLRQANGKERHRSSTPLEASTKMPTQFPRWHISNRSQEISSVRKEATQPLRNEGWHLLRICDIAIVTDHLQTEHAPNLVTSQTRLASVMLTTHCVHVKVRWFFTSKRHVTNRSVAFVFSQQSPYFQQNGYSRRVVVGPWS